LNRSTFNKTTVVVVLVALCGAALLWARAKSPSTTTTADAAGPSAGGVASVVTALPAKMRAPVTTIAWGEVSPAQTQTISFARPGQLAALNVVIGQRAAKGTVLARLTADPLAAATLEQARSASTLAEGEVKRMQALFALQLATTSQVDTAKRVAQDARSALDAQQALAGGRDATEATAPYDGVVMGLTAALGDRLAAGAPILQFGRSDRLRALLGIEPADVAKIHVGDLVTLSPSSSPGPDAPGVLSMEGKVSSLQGLLDPKTQLVNAQVTLSPDVSPMIVAGTRVKAQIVTGSQDGWALPRQAVLTDDRSAYVFAVMNDMAHRVDVRRLSQSQNVIVVSGPINDQMRIVSLGNYELVDGMKTQEKKP